MDLKDRKILFEMDLDSRQSLQSLGKKVGLSKEVVNYRMKRLVERGIITSFYTRIDTSRLGVMLFRTLLRLYNVTPGKEKDLIDYIVSVEKVGWCVSVDGKWSINFIYWADDVADFSDFWRALMSKYGDYINDKNVAVFDRYIQYPKTFLLEGRAGAGRAFPCGRGERLKTDAGDMRILSMIAADSRTPTVDIARKAGMSAKLVSYRIKRLTRMGIIQGYGISLDLEKMGFDYYKLHVNFKRFDKDRTSQMLAFCQQEPRIIYVNELVGGADLELDIYVENRTEYHRLLDAIRYRFSDIIKSFESLQYYREHKHNLFPRRV
jgi:Lrp/AsnC family leucine-responsive transcriptional regulator